MEAGPHHDRLAAAGGDLPDPDRAARGERAADRRGHQARPQRHRLGAGRAADPRVEVRQVAPGSAAPHQHAGARPLRPAARRAPAAARRAELLRLPQAKAAALRGRAGDVPAAHRQRRYRRRRAVTAAAARPETHLRGPHPARLVSGGGGRAVKDPVAVDLPGSPRAVIHLLVPVGRPGTAGAGRRPPGHSMVGGAVMTLIAPTLQAFFTDRLIQQRQASPQTIAAYRDTLRLLLTFVHQRTGKMPAQLDWDDLDAVTISAFLNHLETERHNSTRTRNVRLTAIRSLFSYAALRHPEHALLIQRVLAIPPKRFDKRIVTFLTAAEVDALLAAPDQARWEGRRDRALMLLAVQAGLRVSELTGLNCSDVTLGTGASVRCEGKGRKQRAVPLTSPVEAILRLLAQGTSRTPRRPAVPDPHRTAAQPRCRRTAGQHPRRGCGTTMPVAAGQEDPPARPASQLRHVIAASRRRHLRDRIVARPRRRPVHRRLRPRRHQHQGEEPWHSPPPQAPSPAVTAPPTRCSPSSRACNYADHSS